MERWMKRPMNREMDEEIDLQSLRQRLSSDERKWFSRFESRGAVLSPFNVSQLSTRFSTSYFVLKTNLFLCRVSFISQSLVELQERVMASFRITARATAGVCLCTLGYRCNLMRMCRTII